MNARERKETLKETKPIAQELDPGWVRRDRLERVGLAIIGMLAMGAIVVAIVSIVQSGNTAGEVHKFIQKTPCATAPKSAKCSHVKERLAKEGSLTSPCIEHQRVTGTKGANCERFFIPPSERETGEPPSAGPTAATSTGAGPTAAIAPSSSKGMPHAHPAPAHHPQGGTKAPTPKTPPKAEPAPAGLPPPATSTTPSSGSETITTTVTPPPTEGTSGGTGTTTNPSQGVLGTAGSTLGGAVEHLTETTGTTVTETGQTVGGVVKGLTGGE